jgi:hypothetical protein
MRWKMSDINDLIATQARRAFDKGVRTERNAVLTQLQQELTRVKALPFSENEGRVVIAQMRTIESLIEKLGEQK